MKLGKINVNIGDYIIYTFYENNPILNEGKVRFILEKQKLLKIDNQWFDTKNVFIKAKVNYNTN